MKNQHKLASLAKLCIGLATLSFVLAACSGGDSAPATSNTTGGTVTGVATPSKVSVVNTN